MAVTTLQATGSLHRGLSFESTGAPVRRTISFENTAPPALGSSLAELIQLDTCYDVENVQFTTIDELIDYLRKQCHQSHRQLQYLKHHGGDMNAIQMASAIHYENLMNLSRCIEGINGLANLKELNVETCVFGQ